MKPIISIENLGKKYHIKHNEGSARYKTFRDTLASLPKRLLHRATSSSQEDFWALKDVTLDIMPGERVGIIGRNGAGKSTLLKLLSRITEPSTGKITMRGRVASLLEVGTGFHPELTGRENIYLNGAILGMHRVEITKKFDEIVAFAGVEKFLDTPVKRYSSGMYVRLAFAVAAHLEPEILVVDEVLAVGDADFQKKCMGKMEEVSKGQGRTVLFVSHNMNMINYLCDNCMIISNGQMVKKTKNIQLAISLYNGAIGIHTEWVKKVDEKEEYRDVALSRMAIVDQHGELITGSIKNNADSYIEIDINIKKLDRSLTLGYALYAENGSLLYWSYQTDQEEYLWPNIILGHNRLYSHIPRHFLNEGTYRIEFLASLHYQEWIYSPGKSPCITFEVLGGLSNSPLWQLRRPGLLAPLLPWHHVKR